MGRHFTQLISLSTECLQLHFPFILASELNPHLPIYELEPLVGGASLILRRRPYCARAMFETFLSCAGLFNSYRSFVSVPLLSATVNSFLGFASSNWVLCMRLSFELWFQMLTVPQLKVSVRRRFVTLEFTLIQTIRIWKGNCQKLEFLPDCNTNGLLSDCQWCSSLKPHGHSPLALISVSTLVFRMVSHGMTH